MQVRERGFVHDPSDRAKVTIKESNIHDNRSGAVQVRERGFVHDPSDRARVTIKESNIHDSRSGAVQVRERGFVHDPSDRARVTIKESNIHDSRSGGMQVRERGFVHDPSDRAKVTIKESNIHDNRSGGVQVRERGFVYDPSDVARVTIKEGNIHDVRTGNIGQQPTGEGEGAGVAAVVDPTDVAKATVRETLDENDPSRNMTGPAKSQAHDPCDIARVTTKELNIHDTREGFVSGLDKNGAGYLTNPKDAPATNRQFTSDHEYAGDADGPEVGGYQVADVHAPDTNKQFTSDVEYSGIAASSEAKEPMSYEDIYNATLNEIKEEVALGRSPTQTSAKLGAGADRVRMEIRKVEPDRENDRDFAATKVVDMGPTRAPCETTREKDTLVTQTERQDPELLEAFRDNPFSKPLDSSA